MKLLRRERKGEIKQHIPWWVGGAVRGAGQAQGRERFRRDGKRRCPQWGNAWEEADRLTVFGEMTIAQSKPSGGSRAVVAEAAML